MIRFKVDDKNEKNNTMNGIDTPYIIMSDAPIYVEINPSVMKWLREDSGWTQNEIGRRLNISINLISQWESGHKKPTLNQLRELSKAFKRPLTAFYLPEKLEERERPPDYRRFGKRDEGLTKEMRFTIRKAQYFQEVCKEMMTNTGKNTKPIIDRYNPNEKSEKIAKIERENFGITINDQLNWEDERTALKKWIEVFEQKNICVFSFPMDDGNLRGFTLQDFEPYTIVINSSEIPQARIFTLFHEYAHILLGISALCLPMMSITNPTTHIEKIEDWCDNFAGAFLLPKENIPEDIFPINMKNITKLSNQFKVSKSMVATRLRIYNLILDDEYKLIIDALQRADSLNKTDEDGGGGEFPERKALRQKGKLFCSLVLQNIANNRITDSTALDYLEIKLKSIDNLQKLL
ncbi:MAG: XRE family transcriptional regulator [Methanoregulaceae archaeon]|jgi:Zn-dependent peptidase ImmA (M78 family)/DNA-binding XRE family transcriptional regulator